MADEIIIRAEDVLNPKDLEKYLEKLNILSADIINLHHYLFFYEKIVLFPFDIFAPMSEDRIFWTLTYRALGEMMIITISRILSTDPHDLSLPMLRDFILKSVRKESKEKVEKHFQDNQFDEEVRKIYENIRLFRNKRIAHLDSRIIFPQNATSPAALPKTTLKELQTLFDATVRLFNALCFSAQWYLWYWGYDSKIDNQTTDLEQALDNIARQSYLLNLPEHNPLFWELDRPQMTKRTITIINKYRRKFGMPEVD